MVGPGPLVLDLLAQRRGPQLGPVARPVVGQHPLHGDAMRGEELLRPPPKGRGGLLALIGQDLGVGQPGVVIDGVVQVGVPGAALPGVAPSGLAALEPPPAAGRDPTELLDVDVDQVPGRGPDVGVLLGSTGLDPDPGGRVGPLQPRAPVASQDLVDRGRVQVQVERDPGRPPPPRDPQPDDPTLGTTAQLTRAVPRPRRPVPHVRAARDLAGGLNLPVPAHPAPHRGDRDREPFGCQHLRPAVHDDQPRHLQSPTLVKGRVSVGHEGLLGEMWCLVASHLTGGLHPSPGASPYLTSVVRTTRADDGGVEQRLSEARLSDGTRVAYAAVGRGPVLLHAPGWLTHLEHGWAIPQERTFYERLARGRTLVRYDRPGCGLSGPTGQSPS